MSERVVVGTVDCVRCNKPVELTEDEDFPGLAEGVCCDRLYADWWEGTFVFDLSGPPTSEGGADG